MTGHRIVTGQLDCDFKIDNESALISVIIFCAAESKGGAIANNFSEIPFMPIIETTIEKTIAGASVCLDTFSFRSGNPSAVEQLVIAALANIAKPAIAVEIGTFDGNTTLQIASNIPIGGILYTIDLPPGTNPSLSIHQADNKYIAAAPPRRFRGHPREAQIIEVFADSATVDIKSIAGKQIDFAFIDGSHSYEYVKSDSEKCLVALADRGTIIWHDYQRFWSGVVKYLNELSGQIKLHHVASTSIVYYRSE